MTLAVGITGRRSVWLLTDRRISYPGGRKDDAGVKMIRIEAADGILLVGYAGLGRTVGQTQPSQWMSNAVRGRRESTEGYLKIIGNAMLREFPKHLRGLCVPYHCAIAVALAPQPCTYRIQVALIDGKPRAALTREVWSSSSRDNLPCTSLSAGSGGNHLPKSPVSLREVRLLIRATEDGKLHPLGVAEKLAQVNAWVHSRDSMVSPQCIVAWAFAQPGDTFNNVVAHAFFSETAQEEGGEVLPFVTNGFDLAEFSRLAFRRMHRDYETDADGKVTLESFIKAQEDLVVRAEREAEYEAAIKALPSGPDERLK